MDPRDTRYARQERLAEFGADAQRRLGAATAVVVGLGALGSVAADLLARAGVGRLRLLDRDVVDWPNLQRQVLYTEADADAGRLKAEAARERLHAVNSGIRLEAHAEELHAGNVSALLEGADVVVDGTDNFRTRYLVNDWAVRAGKPWVYAGVVSTYGLVGAHLPGGPCLRCTWPDPPDAADAPTCRSAGVLGPAVSVVAGAASGEALKILAGRDEAVCPGYLYLDLWTGDYRRMAGDRDPACPCCGAEGTQPWLSGAHGTRRAEPVCGGNAVQVPAGATTPDLEALESKLAGTVDSLVRATRYLRFESDGLDIYLFADGRALVRGTEDPDRARAVVEATVGG